MDAVVSGGDLGPKNVLVPAELIAQGLVGCAKDLHG